MRRNGPAPKLTRRSFGSLLSSSMALTCGSGAAYGAEAAAPGACIDVRSFGAKGDGKSDDTKALQSAFDAAGEKDGLVFVPPGNYLSSELHLRRNTALVGSPSWGYGRPGGSVLRLLNDKASCLLNLTGAPGVTIEGLSLEGGQLGQGIHGIFLNNQPNPTRGEDGFRIERCRVTGFSGGGVRLEKAWCYSIRHSMIGFNGADGVYVQGTDGFLLDNWMSGNRGVGLWLIGDSTTITANRIEWSGREDILMSMRQTNVTGNYVDRSGTCGLRLATHPFHPERPNQNLTISDNVFYRSGKLAALDSYDSSHVWLDSAQGVTFVGNTLRGERDDNRSGNWSPSYGIICRALENCVVRDNVMHDGALKELVLDLGEHSGGLILGDNPGRLFKEGRAYGS
jgi:hypothetical protein